MLARGQYPLCGLVVVVVVAVDELENDRAEGCHRSLH
jgi:hypothetical protein